MAATSRAARFTRSSHPRMFLEYSVRHSINPHRSSHRSLDRFLFLNFQSPLKNNSKHTRRNQPRKQNRDTETSSLSNYQNTPEQIPEANVGTNLEAEKETSSLPKPSKYSRTNSQSKRSRAEERSTKGRQRSPLFLHSSSRAAILFTHTSQLRVKGPRYVPSISELLLKDSEKPSLAEASRCLPFVH